ncbi:hypothetical protein [Andreprevotia chitinilytica]|uniref:hypothetical protein n=1 Tax=Andreprevotia chitinilytica TaxID=396808 RepID=UPI0005576A2E|nr:hypothetical protein [Andreprevotia chitinilytica]
MNLHLVIPHANWPDPESQKPVVAGLSLPALSKLLGHAVRTAAPKLDLDIFLLQRFGLPGTAEAPISLYHDLPDEETGYWLRADPVHLRADRDQLLLFDVQRFPLTQADANALCEGLNTLFAEDGFRFVAATPYRWYLRLPADPKLVWTSFDTAIGTSIDTHLPQGEGALKWHRLLNEMQMCLYQHPVNDERVRVGQPPINSVWPWGGGEYPLAQKAIAPHAQVYGNDDLLVALMHSAGGIAKTVPERLAFSGDSDVLVLHDTLRDGALYGDAHAWREGWLRLEEQWFAPALAALQDGRIGTLTFSFPELGLAASINKGRLWRFWLGQHLPWEGV